MNRIGIKLSLWLVLALALIGCEGGFQSTIRMESESSTELPAGDGLVYMSLSKVPGWNYDPIKMSKFTINFNATPTQDLSDVVIGLSRYAPTGFSDLAANIRFSPAGIIDVRNGSGYGSLAAVTYKAGLTYLFQMSINVAAHTYSVIVTPPGGSAVTLAKDYAFRSNQTSVDSLNNFVVYGDTGSAAVTQISISINLPDIGAAPGPVQTPSPAPAPTPMPAPMPTVDDGSANAPAGTPQKPNFFNGYAARPAWKVAGVDYPVGPKFTPTKTPSSISMAGVEVDATRKFVTIMADNITLDGYNFGDYSVFVQGKNARVLNSIFTGGTVFGHPYYGTPDNIYVGYCIIDGLSQADFLVFTAHNGLTVEYSWLKNSASDIVQNHSGGTTIVRYNLIEQAGQAPGAHGDYTQFIGGPHTAIIKYNTTFENGGTTQGFMVEPDISGQAGVIVSAEVSNNSMVNKGGLSFFIGITVPDIVNYMKGDNNYFDASGGFGFSVGGIRGGPGDSSAKTSYVNNVNMVTGAVIAGP